MKRYIHANSDLSFQDVRVKLVSPNGNKYTFSGKTEDKHGFVEGQITKISPYDDADYFWAKIANNGQVKFIQKGKVVDKMQLWSYEEDDYENVEEYFDSLLDETVKELDSMNSKVKPRMMYN